MRDVIWVHRSDDGRYHVVDGIVGHLQASADTLHELRARIKDLAGPLLDEAFRIDIVRQGLQEPRTGPSRRKRR
jgi:hypothetical protein